LDQAVAFGSGSDASLLPGYREPEEYLLAVSDRAPQVSLSSSGCTLRVQDVYEGVEFDRPGRE
jgi:hypothetical protein